MQTILLRGFYFAYNGLDICKVLISTLPTYTTSKIFLTKLIELFVGFRLIKLLINNKEVQSSYPKCWSFVKGAIDFI